MRMETVERFLGSLSDRVAAPGGGASAGLHAAQAAALVGMVARYSDGEKYSEHAATITAVRNDTDQLRELALTLAEDDASAFGAVGAAYALPRSTDEQKEVRSRAIAAALVEASRVPARVVAVAEQVVGLAEQLLPIGNRNVISDIAAAAEAARAAASTARVNMEVNLNGISGAEERSELITSIAEVDDITARADKVTAAVREVFGR